MFANLNIGRIILGESTEPEKETEKKKKYNDISGLVFTGCIITGLGISFATNTMPVGIFIGLGVGFIMMAVIRYRARN
jgi:Na+-transporting NADH:ubiquinone oxidoreductase subunit NqrD